MKIYTKTGDKGKTSLVGGKRVAKTHTRLEAYGTVDELNAFIGLLLEQVSDEKDVTTLQTIQNWLFSVGCGLASDPEKEIPQACTLPEQAISLVEAEIDRLDASLPPLNEFVLPGGGQAAALAHVCRTVARRAERCIYRVQEESTVQETILVFVNRLSDYFFVLSRKEALIAKKPEKKWDNSCK